MSGVFDTNNLMSFGNFLGISGGMLEIVGVLSATSPPFASKLFSTAFISEVKPLGCSLQAEAMMLGSSWR